MGYRLNKQAIMCHVNNLKTKQENLYNVDGTLDKFEDVLESERLQVMLDKFYKQLDYIKKRDSKL